MHARRVKDTGNLLLDSIVNSAFRNGSEWNFNAQRNAKSMKQINNTKMIADSVCHHQLHKYLT
jgi:hypothetical protein